MQRSTDQIFYNPVVPKPNNTDLIFMTVELIPVLEIGYNNQDVPVPDKYPYWENAAIWDKYNQDGYLKAGFKDPLKPYLAGSSFYLLTDITEDNLIKLTRDHTEDLRNEKYTREQASAFFGGYVLRINGQDKFFPQCCGDLSDIIYWEQVVNGNKNAHYEGHPAPMLKVTADSIIFDFLFDEYDEPFQPIPPDTILQVDRSYLKKAIEQVKEELVSFSERLQKINETEQLNVVHIDELLVWHNSNQT